MYLRAEWQLLDGLKPWLKSENVGSNIISKIILITSSTNLSLGEAIVKGLSLPFFLEMCILLPGKNWNCSLFNLLIILFITSRDNPSKVVGVIPGVMLPGLLLSLL